jgi:peptidoglycan/LPS O-acetylase OafA/YrhL
MIQSARRSHRIGCTVHSLYLLHPVVWQTLWPGKMIAGHTLSPTSAIALTVVLTLAAAWASYHWYELPLIRMGKKFTPPPHDAFANAAADGNLGAHRQ